MNMSVEMLMIDGHLTEKGWEHLYRVGKEDWMPELVYVLHWKGFEWVLRPEKPHHEKRIEITLGEHIVDRVVGKSGAPKWMFLWAFDFKEVDSEGRRVYEATMDPYESIVEAAEQEKLARYVLAHVEVEIEEGGG